MSNGPSNASSPCVEAASWRTSSHSKDGGACAEVASWRASTASSGGSCVQVGQGAAVVGVRDSKDPGGPVLAFSAAAWEAFTGHLKAAA